MGGANVINAHYKYHHQDLRGFLDINGSGRLCHRQIIPCGAFILVAGGEDLRGLGAGVAEVLGDGLVGDLVHALGHHHDQAPTTGHGAPKRRSVLHYTERCKGSFSNRKAAKKRRD